MKVIFESEAINLNDYLTQRKKIDNPYVYVSGRHHKIPVPIENFLLLQKENSCFYSMGVEDNQTIEVIEFDELKIHLYSDKTPDEIISDSKLREILGIIHFEKMETSTRKQFENLLRQEGMRVTKCYIYKRNYPYVLSKNKEYLVIKTPIFIEKDQLEEDKQIFEKAKHQCRELFQVS